MDERADSLLWPRPRKLEPTGERLALGERIDVVVGPEVELLGVREALADGLGAVGCTVASGEARSNDSAVRLALVERSVDGTDGGTSPERYRLRVDGTGIEVTAVRPAGLFYGVVTLAQWVRSAAREESGRTVVPGVEIEDAPELGLRGALVDVSRDRVPTMETLFELVDWLAALKMNQLQLYMEHTFAYEGHEMVWRGATPFTAEEIRRLDLHCRDRFVELVPCQNSLGHMHRWLRHDGYRHLAEVPAGLEHPFSDEIEPFSLCPTDPETLELLDDLYGQLLPNFGSDRVNVGLDETFDLGRGRSAAACEEHGVHAVYLEFLREVRELAAEHGSRIQFWGDIVLESPDLVPEIPEDATALVWGYEADHPFDEQAALFEEAGIDAVLCPGTSSWNSFVGRASNAVANIVAAAGAASSHGAAGVLVCDWGDHGHLQPLPVSLLGFLASAGAAWNPEAVGALESRSRLAALLDARAFRDRAEVTGEAVLRLGDAHRRTGTPDVNGTALFHLVVSPDDDLGHVRYEGLAAEGLRRAEGEIEAALELLEESDLERPDGELVLRELGWAGRLARLGTRIGRARLAAGPDVPLSGLSRSRREPLAAELAGLIESHEPLWLARSRPGGRLDSVRRLERTLERLRGGRT